MNQLKLTKLRQQIDKTNSELVMLLNKRAEIAKRIGELKQGTDVYQPGREAQVLERVRSQNPGPLTDEALTRIMTEVIGACRNLEQRLRVAYLGPEGTYSEEAALQFAGGTSALLPCVTIDDTVLAVDKGDADIAVVPVENSTEGAVNRTLDLLLGSGQKIVGEITLPIHHQLLGKTKNLGQIDEVAAHPQALAQCRRWLEQKLPKARLTPVSSNAEAARLATGSTGLAAVASRLAAKVYGLEILASNIEDSPNNTTRFLVLGNKPVPPTGNDKTSLVCSVPNRAGSLFELIGIFAKSGINMTKLESRPAESALWDYVFYIDLDGHEADTRVASVIQAAREHATMVKVLGSYPKASSPS